MASDAHELALLLRVVVANMRRHTFELVAPSLDVVNTSMLLFDHAFDRLRMLLPTCSTP